MSDRRETQSPLITRCPYCETSFRVTQAHLQAANGAVRCGACLLVFPASEHMVDPRNRDPKTTTPVDDTDVASLEADIHTLEETDEDHGYWREYDDQYDQTLEEAYELERAEEEDDHEAAADEPKTTVGEVPDEISDESGPEPGFADTLEVESDPDDIIGPVQRQASRWTLAWLAGSVLLVGTLGLQYAWMQKDMLARDANYRSYYVTACAYLGCQVPDYRDVSALKIASLTVRSHSEVDEALVFNALLRNDAPFKQRFPPLDLEFTDTQSERVAARRFKPREYLGGEMAGLKYIPARTEVRILLEVVDPGESALGYSVTIPESW